MVYTESGFLLNAKSRGYIAMVVLIAAAVIIYFVVNQPTFL